MAEDPTFPGGGETGALIRSMDWSRTPLGPVEHWPMSLKSLVRVMLHARQPMIVWWGPELTQIYNDAMLDSMRDKHPLGMGQPGREAWKQAWLAVGHELQKVVDEGTPIWNEDMFVPVDRNGRIEDAWWTYSYSPVFDDDGRRAGILIICTETTAGVVARKELERARREAELARSELTNAFMQAPIPVALLNGPDLVYTFANPSYERLVGRQVVGKRLTEAFSDAEVGAFVPILEGVFRTGVGSLLPASPLTLTDPQGVSRTQYIDAANDLIRDIDGVVTGVISIVTDVTQVVEARLAAEERQRERAVALERETGLRAQAEQANRSKDEFLAMLGHELRNPLAPISTALQLMKLRAEPALVHERVIIERQVKHLSHLVDDLLDVSRIASGKVELHQERLNLASVVAEAIETASPLIEQRAHQLVVELPPTGLEIDGDAQRLTQVVGNLLTNAAKYTEPGGKITIRGAREGGDVVLHVRDTGVGIAADILPRVFDLFAQARQSIDRAQGGLGLGLAIVRSLVRMHGGSVSAHSDGHGHGSELVVRLPAARAPTPMAPRPTTLGSDALTMRPPSGRKILVVDDNIDGAELLADALTLAGHETRVAHDGPSALLLVRHFHPDVAILDIGLPVMDGYELARHLRQLPELARLKIIALTGYGQPTDHQRSASAGFDAHLVKPLTISVLSKLLDKLWTA